MLNDASGFHKIYLATGYTDLRRGMEGLGKHHTLPFSSGSLRQKYPVSVLWQENRPLHHGNWIEIEHKYTYIPELQHLLDEHGIPYPEEYEID